jgi:acyl dehydratase
MARLFYENVEIGMELPTLIKHPTPKQLVMWAGVSGDYSELHYDKDVAQREGFPGIIVHGQLAMSFLCQLVFEWMGEKGILKKLACNYRGLNFPGEDLICKGRVAKKYTQDGENYVECEIWAENSVAETTTTGSATVILPSQVP